MLLPGTGSRLQGSKQTCNATNIVTEDIQDMEKKVKKANIATCKEATQRFGAEENEDTGLMRIYSQRWPREVTVIFSNKIHNNLMQICSLMLEIREHYHINSI